MLSSSFSNAKVKTCFLSRGIRQGVEVYQVNPAFSTVIGRVMFMERYGLSVHQAAAPGPGPSFPRLFRRHPESQGCSPGQRGPCRLRRTCKEAGEARMDPVGGCSGAVETGPPRRTAQHRLGRSADGGPPQSGSGSGLNGDQLGVPGWDSRAEPPGTVGAAVRQWRISRRG